MRNKYYFGVPVPAARIFSERPTVFTAEEHRYLIHHSKV
jgi:hypothetical protein